MVSFASAVPSSVVIKKYFEILKKETFKMFDENGPKLFDYADIEGDELLRKKIVENELAGENSDSEMVLITNGGQEAIKLTIESLLKRGEMIMMERLSYVGLEEPIKNCGGKIVCFTDNLNNLSLKKIEMELVKNKPKLVYLIPDFSNPGGEILKSSIRRLITKLALKLSFWIIEDQTYRELYYDIKSRPNSMFSISDRVVIVGSISKIIVPGLRIGWLVTKNELLRKKMVRLKESYNLSTNNISQKLIASLFVGGGYREIMMWVRGYYGSKMKMALDGLEKMMPKEFKWTKPKGGFYIWIVGPKGFNSRKTLNKALDNGVGFIPGNAFYYGYREENTFRLSISAIKGDDILEGIRRLVKTIKGEKAVVKNEAVNGFIIKSFVKRLVINWLHRRQ